MASKICVECSSEVADSALQCPECGFPFDTLAPVECPNCKDLVVFASDLCPTCGFPFDKLAAGMADDMVVDRAAAAETVDPEAAEAGIAGAGVAETGAAVVAGVELSPELTSDDDVDSDPLAREAAESAPDGDFPVLQPDLDDRDLTALCNNPIDNDYIVYAIKNYISEVKTDLVNKPIKSFIKILTELDNSNTELYKTLVKQGVDTLNEVQGTALTTVNEVSKMAAQQSQESISKSQELTLTIVNEIHAATTTLKEAHETLAADLSNTIRQVSAELVQQAVSATPTAPSNPPPESAPASTDMSEYILYLCIGMLVFTIANLFITIYAVKLIK